MNLRYTAILLLMSCSSCGPLLRTPHTQFEAEMLPDSDVALIKRMTTHDDGWSYRDLNLSYLDGTKTIYRGSYDFSKLKIKPGIHTLGFDAGLSCIFYGLWTCLSNCYAGVILMAEAGQPYDYDILKDLNRVIVTDKAGKKSPMVFVSPTRFFPQRGYQI